MKIINAIGICGLGGVLFLVGCSSASVGPGSFGTSSGDATSGSGSTSGATSGQGDDGGAVSSQSGSPTTASGSSSGIANGGSAGMPAGSGSAGSGSAAPMDGGAAADATAGIPANNAEIDYTQTQSITMDSFTLEPNQEVYKCQDFPNPWGTQVDIKTYALNMSEGSHHMFPFYKTGATKGTIIDCPAGGVTFGPFTFTSQLHSVSQTYPDTVGATIPQSTGFTMMVHYLNTSAAPITTHVTLQMAIAKSGVVTQHAGVLYLDNTRLQVPPGVSMSTLSYTLSQDIQIMWTWSHMHQQATGFTATASSGETLFTTTEWAEPPAKPYAPPLSLKSGTNITWSCTYDNKMMQTLTFGQSAVSNVMCISISVFYPIQNTSDPVIGMP